MLCSVMTANGTESIYHSAVQVMDGKCRLMRIADLSRWVETSVKVFCGAFICLSDKKLLVNMQLLFSM